MRRSILLFVLCAALAACVNSPDLPPADRQARGDAPRLVPISGLLAQAGPPSDAVALRLSATPQTRAANLRARAAALRGPVIGQDDRARLLGSATRIR